MIHRISLLSIALMATAALMLSAIACGDSNSGDAKRLAVLEDEVTQLSQASTRAQVIATMDVADRAGFHAIDTDLQTASSINSQYLGTVRKVRQAVVGTQWPEDLTDEATAFRVALEDFQRALEGNNLLAAKAAATKTHDAYHELSDGAWPYVANETPVADHD